jgi:hypothetical protein
MSPNDDGTIDVERQACAMLAESVARIDGRVRSRLNQARQAAVAEAARTRRRPALWRSFTLMPTAGAVAGAVLVAMVLWHQRPQGSLPIIENGQATVEDLDLLADGEALDLVQEEDGSFYEWAAEQTDVNSESG